MALGTLTPFSHALPSSELSATGTSNGAISGASSAGTRSWRTPTTVGSVPPVTRRIRASAATGVAEAHPETSSAKVRRSASQRIDAGVGAQNCPYPRFPTAG